MTVKTLIENLKSQSQDAIVKVASDEEWNTIYTNIEIDTDKMGGVVFSGLDGSEEDL